MPSSMMSQQSSDKGRFDAPYCDLYPEWVSGYTQNMGDSKGATGFFLVILLTKTYAEFR